MEFKYLSLVFFMGMVCINASPISLTEDKDVPAAEPVKAVDVVVVADQTGESAPQPGSDEEKFIIPLISMGFPSGSMFGGKPVVVVPPPPPPPPPALPQIVSIPPNSQISVVSSGTPIEIQQIQQQQPGTTVSISG